MVDGNRCIVKIQSPAVTGSPISKEYHIVKDDIPGAVTGESCAARSSVIDELRILYQHIAAGCRIDRTVIGGHIPVKNTVFDSHDGLAEPQRGTVIGTAVPDGEPIQPGVESFPASQVEESAIVFKVDNGSFRTCRTAELDIIAFEIEILVIVAAVSAGGDLNHVLIRICFGEFNGLLESQNRIGFRQAVVVVIAGCTDMDDSGIAGRIISLSDFDTVGDTVSIAVGDIDLRAVEIFIKVLYSVVILVENGIRSVIRIQAGSSLDIVGNSIRIGIHEFLTADIDRTCRAGYAVNILDEQIFIRSGIDARRTGFQIASGSQHRIGCDVSGSIGTPVIRIIIVPGDKSYIPLIHGSGYDGILYRGVLLEVNAASVAAASIRNRHVIEICPEVVHVQIGIIVHSPIAQQQAVLHRQHTVILIAGVITVSSADCTTIVE